MVVSACLLASLFALYLLVRMFVCLLVCLFACVCLYVCLFACLHVCMFGAVNVEGRECRAVSVAACATARSRAFERWRAAAACKVVCVGGGSSGGVRPSGSGGAHGEQRTREGDAHAPAAGEARRFGRGDSNAGRSAGRQRETRARAAANALGCCCIAASKPRPERIDPARLG